MTIMRRNREPTEVKPSVEKAAFQELLIDDAFLLQFTDVLNQEQLNTLAAYKGFSLGGQPSEALQEEFKNALQKRLKSDTRTANSAELVGPDTIAAQEDTAPASLYDLSVLSALEYIRCCSETIFDNKPHDLKIKRVGRIITYLVPERAEEQNALAEANAQSHTINERSKAQLRTRSFERLIQKLSSLTNDLGSELVNEISTQILLDVAGQITHPTASTIKKLGDSNLTAATVARKQRLAEYTPSGEVDKTLVSEATTETRASRQKVIRESLGIQSFNLEWIGEQPEKLEVSRYVDEIELEVIRALSPKLKKIAESFDRNPVNKEGLDKIQAIIDQAAKCIAGGVMPWHPNSSIRHEKSSKTRAKGYPETLWYPYDISPNTPRVYFALGPEVPGEIMPTKRQMFIIAETDKAHQIEALAILSTQARSRLRVKKVGSR